MRPSDAKPMVPLFDQITNNRQIDSGEKKKVENVRDYKMERYRARKARAKARVFKPNDQDRNRS